MPNSDVPNSATQNANTADANTACESTPAVGKLNAAALRSYEAAAVADTVALILEQGWDVLNEDSFADTDSTGRSSVEASSRVHSDEAADREPHTTDPNSPNRTSTTAGRGQSAGNWRRARLSDIAVLIPDRNSLPSLEDALNRLGIPYRAEASSLVYSTSEVRDLLIALQAVADPTDELALVAALRSPLYGCGDDDLADWKLNFGGRFSLIARQPEDAPADHPVARSIEHLSGLLDAKRWENPSRLLDRLIRERGLYETAVVSRRPRDVWRRLRFLVAQARAWADADGTDLRDYLAWARMQGDERSRVTEAILPETDDECVRILTVHGSKGLEFPVAVVSGMTSRLNRAQQGPTVAIAADGAPAVRIKAGVQTSNYESRHLADRDADRDERLRLLYVACTRARDHLVVSLCREAPKESPTDSKAETAMQQALNSATTYAEALAAAGAANAILDPIATLDPAAASRTAPSSGNSRAQTPPQEQPQTRGQWLAEFRVCLAKGATPTVASPSKLARSHLGTDPSQLEEDHDDSTLPLRLKRKGRYGSAVGRAVHAVLQEVDLTASLTDGEINAEARRQAENERVISQAAVVARLTRAALRTEPARRAAMSQHWQEILVAAPVVDDCEILVEGYVDLMYRSPEGLVVVDWKTDAIGSDDDISEKMVRYRLQGAAYAAAVEAAVGEAVARVDIVFLHRDADPIVVPVSDLPEAINEIKAIVRSWQTPHFLSLPHP